MRYGAGPSGPMRTLGQYMLGSGATFGYASCGPFTALRPAHVHKHNLMLTAIILDSFFMSIGSVIRTEGNTPLATEAFARARRQPAILPRKHGGTPRQEEGEQ